VVRNKAESGVAEIMKMLDRVSCIGFRTNPISPLAYFCIVSPNGKYDHGEIGVISGQEGTIRNRTQARMGGRIRSKR